MHKITFSWESMIGKNNLGPHDHLNAITYEKVVRQIFSQIITVAAKPKT